MFGNNPLSLALGGLRKRGAAAWMGDLINQPAFQVAKNDSVLVNENARLDLQVTASKTTGPNPLVVVFDLFTDSTFYGVSRPEHECSFWADFDDEGSTYENIPSDSLFGNDANIGHGPEMCHAWETTGVKTVKFYVWHPPTNRYGYAEIEITVVDADTYFAGRTVVCSQTSDFTDAPAGATQTTSFSDAYAALNALGTSTPARLLFRGGETYNFTDLIYARNGFYYGSYGTGNAILTPSAGPVTYSNDCVVRIQQGHGCVFYRLDIIGDYDPITGTGDDAVTSGVKIQDQSKVSIYKCTIKGWSIPLSTLTGGDHKEIAVLDNHIADWRDLGFYATIEKTAVVGNKIAQNPLATSGPGEKTNEDNLNVFTDTGETNFILDNVRVYGDYQLNLVVMLRDNTTKILEELFETDDWEFTEGLNDSGYGNSTHELDLVNPLPENKTLEVRSRIWADHGPIRVIYGQWTAYNNILESYNGWPADGEAIQPCIRDNTLGLSGGRSFISYNMCKGGVEPIVVTTANTYTVQNLSSSVVECNYIVGDQSTTTFIKTAIGNITIRNNLGVLPDIAPISNPFQGCVKYQNPFGDTGTADLPVRTYNNTFAVLRSTENGAEDAPIIFDDFGGDYTDTDDANNLFYYPDMPTSLPNYSPLSTDGLYRPESGSAALGSGVAKGLVWDDLSGKLVQSPYAIGCFNSENPSVIEADLAETSITGETTFALTKSYSQTGGDEYLSVDIEYINYSYIYIQLNISGAFKRTFFDITGDGSIKTSAGGSLLSENITELSSGIFRLSLTFNNRTSNFIRIGFSNEIDDLTPPLSEIVGIYVSNFVLNDGLVRDVDNNKELSPSDFTTWTSDNITVTTNQGERPDIA